MAGRTILHVDMDAFFAAIEQLRRPDLRGRPVVVGGRGDPHRRGVVATASYEARRYGIRSAMPLRTAYRLCPDAVFLPVDMAAYEAASERLYRILRETGARIEPAGLDEAYLDVSHLPDPGVVIARRIKERILQDLGLTASVGVAPNKLVAKVASGLEKPDGLTEIPPEDVEARLQPLPVTVLSGVGPKTARAVLEAFGVRTVGELAQLSEAALQRAFGPRQGSFLYRAARGIDDRPVETSWERKSSSRERTFQVDVRHPPTLRAVITRLTREVAEDLRAGGHRAATVTLKIRVSPFTTMTRSRTLAEPTDDPATLAHVALQLLQRVILDRPVRLVGVRATKLSPRRAEVAPPGPLGLVEEP